MNNIGSGVLGLLLLLLHGCALQLAHADLVGIWHITEEGRALLGMANTVNMKIELRPDGTFISSNFPFSSNGHARWSDRFSGTGKWVVPSVARTEGYAIIGFKFASGEKVSEGVVFSVGKDAEGLYIFDWLDDVDGRVVRFRRH